MLSNSDIRVVPGDLEFFATQLEIYLGERGYKVTAIAKTDVEWQIIAENKNKSVIKLLLNPSSHITSWKLCKCDNGEIKITAQHRSFRKFQYYFYGILFSLLTLAGVFFNISMRVDGKGISDYPINYFTFISLLIAAVGIFLWHNRTKPYSRFFDKYYEGIQRITLNKEQAIELHPSFPETMPGFMIFIIFIAIYVLTNVTKLRNFGAMLIGAMVFAALAIFLLVTIIIYEEKTVRTIFLLTALCLCVPMSIYANLPLIGFSSERVFNIARKIVDKNQLLSYKLKEHPELSDRAEVKKIKLMMKQISIGMCIFYMIVILIIIFLIVSALYLPVEIFKRLDRFGTKNKESLYFKAMKPERVINLFNCCVVLIWLSLGIANLSGLFLSISTLGKLLFPGSSIIKSEIVSLFYDWSGVMISSLCEGNGSSKYLHATFILLYALPIPLLFVGVLLKNLRLTVRAISLIKKANAKKHEIISRQVELMCQAEDIQIPMIWVSDSDDVPEGGSFLGFPVYRNILIIKRQTVDQLMKRGDALEAFLAHEIYHLKQHTIIWKILNLLSDFTLLGNGFLAILRSSYELEFSADIFAADWLKKQGKDPAGIVSALDASSEINEESQISQLIGNLNFAKGIENQEYRKNIIKISEESSRSQKFIINLKLLYQLYFSEYIISYIHPDINYRVERIEEYINETV